MIVAAAIRLFAGAAIAAFLFAAGPANAAAPLCLPVAAADTAGSESIAVDKALAGETRLAQAGQLGRLPGLRDPRGRGQLACNSGCLRGCQSAYRRCQQSTRNWARCSAQRRRCIRRCGC